MESQQTEQEYKTLKSQQKFQLPKIYNFDFDEYMLEKKWLYKDQDITDYFNYGFTEETWRHYVNKVRTQILNIDSAQYKDNPFLKQTNIQDNLPVDLGGLDPPFFQDFTQNSEIKFFKDEFLKNQFLQQEGCLYYIISDYLNQQQNYNKQPHEWEQTKELQLLKNNIQLKNSSISDDVYKVQKKNLNVNQNNVLYQGANGLVGTSLNYGLAVNMHKPIVQHPQPTVSKFFQDLMNQESSSDSSNNAQKKKHKKDKKKKHKSHSEKSKYKKKDKKHKHEFKEYKKQ